MENFRMEMDRFFGSVDFSVNYFCHLTEARPSFLQFTTRLEMITMDNIFLLVLFDLKMT